MVAGRPKKETNPQTILNQELTHKLNNLRNKVESKIHEINVINSNDIFWYGPPVSPVTFIESNEYLGNSSTKDVYPWVIETMEEIFSDGEYFLPKYHTAVVVCSKGSGKSYWAGIMYSYIWYLFRSFKNFLGYINDAYGTSLAYDTTMSLIGMAPSKEQAKTIVFNNAGKMINRCKAFRDRAWLPNSNITSELRYSDFDPQTKKEIERLKIIPGNSSETGTLGHAFFGGCLDEAAFFIEKHTDPIKDAYDELSERRESRFGNSGLIALISSANSDDVYMERLFKDAETKERIFTVRKPLYDCKPEYVFLPRYELTVKVEKRDGSIGELTITPPEAWKPLYDADLIGSLKKFNSIPTIVGDPFYPDFMLLLSKINRERVDPCPDLGKNVPESPLDSMTRLPPNFVGASGARYKIHLDLAKGDVTDGHCGVGFAMSHKASINGVNKIKLDLAIRFKSPTGKEIQVDEILEFIKWLRNSRGFLIDHVTVDQWNYLYPTQVINKWNMGIIAEQQAVGYKEHTFLKNCMLNGQLDFYEDSNLFFELKRLRDFGSSVEPADGSFKDEADAVAGAVYLAEGLGGNVEVVKPRATQGVMVSRGGPMSVGGNKSPGAYRQANYFPKYRNI